ncbi:MAG TPA: efflux RND transporter periplasmic adaptor subunit [Caulifigura sp.]|jgi:RND family efflux transporter MFP subunit|nr:efflux RND transporter periplasmic adaptor subunit [Caulifigura sp.]
MKRPALTRIFLCLLAGFAGCQKQSGYQEPPPPMVDILDAVSIPLTDEMTFNGTTRARASVDLRAKVTGYLKEIRFQDGQRVKKGDVLFVIERDPFERELEARQADLKRAQAGLNLAEANQRRTEKLRTENATTQQQLDVVVAEKATSEANVAAADAAVKQAELNLDYTLITAPMEGRIGRHLVDEGNLVQAGTMSLAVIESIAPIDVYYYISEAQVLRLMTMVREGRLTSPEIEAPKIFMGLQDDDDYPYEGLLKFRDLGVDPGTGTILRRAEFANEKGDLIPGLFVRMKAPLGDKQPRVLIEDVAIITDQSGDSVLVVERRPKADRKTGKLLDPPQYEYAAKRRPVQVGRRLNHMRVIDSGLKAGEWVITAGIQKARDGSPINFVRELVEKSAKKRAEELKPETGTDQPAPLPEPIEPDADAAPSAAPARSETPPAKQDSSPAESPKAETPAPAAPAKETENPQSPPAESKSSARSLSESTPA